MKFLWFKHIVMSFVIVMKLRSSVENSLKSRKESDVDILVSLKLI
ncbi:hypothetical protein DsansV1_C04g0036531 [Dioscorea sansibarensis]